MEWQRDDDPDLSAQEPGTTRVLGDEGWEDATFIDPGDDWRLLDDGSWAAPDGRTRSWPLAGPESPEPRG